MTTKDPTTPQKDIRKLASAIVEHLMHYPRPRPKLESLAEKLADMIFDGPLYTADEMADEYDKGYADGNSDRDWFDDDDDDDDMTPDEIAEADARDYAAYHGLDTNEQLLTTPPAPSTNMDDIPF